MSDWQVVRDAAELADALKNGVQQIEVSGEISDSPMITLGPGVSLRGGTLVFKAKGVRLTTDNTLEDISIETRDTEVAILNDPSVSTLGTLTLRNVRTIGQILLEARDSIRAGHVVADGVTVESADVRGRTERPHGFGVDALQGGFTLWNRQADKAVDITAELRNIAAGTEATPVRGSGVFVAGHTDWDGAADGGTLHVSTLTTGEIHTDGGIASGTPDLISGGVFVIGGAYVDEVINEGPVTTNGQNDMVLDTWGAVTNWTAKAPVTSNGPSGIGFVNFGDTGRLDVQAPIVTNGPGARAFNVYDGSLEHASFHSLVTHGDGSVGVQVSKELPKLEIAGDLTTDGGEGQSLVKGVQMTLKAIALSVKPGGHIGTVSVGGQIKTKGDDVVTVEIEGNIDTLTVAGGISAEGKGSDAVHLTGELDLSGVNVTAADGKDIVTS
ncbi:hypothetical protein [Antrihabitans cavernicola]|uniref:Uncharacterized protein n=1 Tax=Antrihabitans cavernicola TaxID=2495913 RepID=A0A5A7SHJ6_9NOCA|nr:hypothetical protein [Spelaeibacter cavernicola]KAA0024083.1 hypothetical protein FOY51_05835 [Spelaeibacter cavernicola]